MHKEPIIKVQNLTARYGENTILEDVTFHVDRGEIFMILGSSGCGKSTLLKHINGLLKPYSGRVIVNGTDIMTADDETMREVRKTMGMLFQADALFGSMTLFENIALPLYEYTDLSPDMIDRIVKMKLALVNLPGYENHMPSELSGGMRKRAGLARAMALDPLLLFFDEPWAGLDPVTAAELDILIKSINTAMGTTMVIVTQELASIFGLAERVIMLDKSARGIVAQGNPVELREHSQDPRVVNYFNRKATAGD
ncbi:MAG TPA: ATP-binding cassette domain-containing protein [Syntrophales bacterium]|nr:ATP-binding cassette domain-containing protein [Syntrophales bacterium]